MSVPIISVTGTKGKTSIIRALDAVLFAYSEHRLRVDTDGAWLDGELRLSHQDSKRIWGLAPGNSPGRFMTLFAGLEGNLTAVLECNVFSSKACGLGYSSHQVGVFTNVYDDHAGSDKKLLEPSDIAAAKSFIFSRISRNGYAVYNADDALVKSQLKKIPKTKAVSLVACSLKDSPAKIGGDIQIYVHDDEIFLNDRGLTYSGGKLIDYKMYVPGFEQSGMNILLSLGALRGFFDARLDQGAIKALKEYAPSEEHGRLIIFKTKNNVKIIFDFAHEQASLQSVAKLARQQAPGGQLIGVLRLSPTKSDAAIKAISAGITDVFDQFIIYDKIDGVSRRPDSNLNPYREEKIGYTSMVFNGCLKAAGAKTERIIQEGQALERAASLARPGDIIVHIHGNEVKESLSLLKKKFGKLERLSGHEEKK